MRIITILLSSRRGGWNKVSTTEKETCILCVQLEAAKLISLCVELGLELKNDEDVLNFIRVNGLCSLYRDRNMLENVINTVLELL